MSFQSIMKFYICNRHKFC